MTTFLEIEEAVVDVLRTHDDLTHDNCLSGDLEGLKKGLARVVNVKYAKVTRKPLTITMVEHVWTLKIDVYVPYRGRIQDMEETLATERQKVIDTLAKYPKLDNLTGVHRAEIINGDAPEPLSTRKAAYRGQRLYLEVHQAVEPARVG